jgi:chorismate mutase
MGLNELRCEIDALDERLVQLLNERARIALRIGLEKAKDGVPVQDPDRERNVIQRVCSMNSGPISDTSLADVYHGIMDACTEVQHDLAEHND